MRTADFNFSFSRELIAARPSGKRDHSRLLVLDRDGSVEHKRFADIAEYLDKGDMLLLNNTKVFPARITGTKPSGGKLEVLLMKETAGNGTWEVLCKGRFNGQLLFFGSLRAEIWTEEDAGGGRPKRCLRFTDADPSRIADLLWQYGSMPLPPYIRRMPDEADKERYQTVYAQKQGSIAAPTAGLHFTKELLEAIRKKGVAVRTLTLHVGIGTFKPIKAELLREHTMDSEYFEFGAALIDEIREVKSAGNRLVTVGTTATRAVEGFMSGRYKDSNELIVTSNELKTNDKDLSLSSDPLLVTRYSSLPSDSSLIKGYTDIFIYPGYEFKVVDSLITNFHLPCSTPLMLAAAFSGFENISRAYDEAIAMNYRFFSYGDAMLIL